MKPERLIAPGNDYRSLRSRSDGPMPSVAVIIPVYNRGLLLANVLAGLSRQTFESPFQVVVVDDGSEENIGAVVGRFSETIDIRLVRQERDGFGLARARNLGLGTVTADVVAFLDADCIPGDGWLAGHVAWHRKASNLVVTGSRRHLDALLDANAIASGAADVHDMARPLDSGSDPYETDDWRGLVYRRSQRLILGDAGFRAAIGGNSSMRREMILEVGGASREFRSWGGEDTELAWRLWNAGTFIIPEDRAIVYHQSHGDPRDIDQRREASRRRALPLIADQVPHRFYRKEPSHLYSVPKVSWLIAVGDETESNRAWREVSRASYTDSELILIGHDDAVRSRVTAAGAARALTVTGTFAEAVARARGEVLALADGRARFDRGLLARAMQRFDDGRVSAVRVGYRGRSKRVLRLADLIRIDEESGRSGLPFFGLIRRREIMKDRISLDDPAAAWSGALGRSKTDLFVTDLVEIPENLASRRRRLPGPSEIRAAGPGEIVEGVQRMFRSRRRDSREEPAVLEPGHDRVPIEYVGLPARGSLGGTATLEAIGELMPWARVETDLANPRAIMVGGGTTINNENCYLDAVRLLDGPNLERIVFGAGVGGVEGADFTERIEDWDSFLRSAIGVGVRGPDSLARLRAWGYQGPVTIVGDPALSLDRPEGVDRVAGRVVVCPTYTAGMCWGASDAAVFDQLSLAIDRLVSEGRDVVLMTVAPEDDRWAIELMRRSGRPGLGYVAGYEDLGASLRQLASADLVVGERLHAVVLAAAVGTPFVAIEHGPAIRDFVRSLGAEGSSVRTDQIERLSDALDSALTAGTAVMDERNRRVRALQQSQRVLSGRFQSVLAIG